MEKRSIARDAAPGVNAYPLQGGAGGVEIAQVKGQGKAGVMRALKRKLYTDAVAATNGELVDLA